MHANGGGATFLLTILLCSTPVGGTRCEILLARTISDVWLTDSDPVRFIPMLMSRIIISLKEVAGSQRPYLNPEVPNGLSTYLLDSHFPQTAGGVRLSQLKNEPV